MENENALFWAKVDKTPGLGPDGQCWEWLAAKNTHGYGVFGYQNATWVAHRFSYTISNGPIPTGAKIRHSCDNPKCVNPAHLNTGTQAQNVADMLRRHRQANQKKTHCKRGHPLFGGNLIMNGKNRACRICFNEKRREGYAKNKNNQTDNQCLTSVSQK